MQQNQSLSRHSYKSSQRLQGLYMLACRCHTVPCKQLYTIDQGAHQTQAHGQTASTRGGWTPAAHQSRRQAIMRPPAAAGSGGERVLQVVCGIHCQAEQKALRFGLHLQTMLHP